jgi:hypothetical protein
MVNNKLTSGRLSLPPAMAFGLWISTTKIGKKNLAM